MSRGLLTKLVILAAAASLVADQLRRLHTLSSPSYSSSRRRTIDGWDRSEPRKHHPKEDVVVVVAPTLSDGNATMIRRHDEEGKGGGEGEEVEEEEEGKKTERWKPLPWSLPSRIDKSAIQRSSLDFMNDLWKMKRGMNITLPWEGNGAGAAVRMSSSSLPKPIISLNLPKSATSSLYEYFQCGGLISSHAFSTGSTRIGDCMRDNYLLDEPPFRGCDSNANNQRIQFYSDIGIQGPKCFYSSLHDGGLEHIAKFYPNATILLLHRKFEGWHSSMLKWGDGRLLKIWRKNLGLARDGQCHPGDVACWRNFYNAHREKIRRFAIEHPSLTYLELELDEKTPMALEMYTGISSDCFMDCHPGRPKDPNVDLRTYKKCMPANNTT